METKYDAIRRKINNFENDQFAMLLVKGIESNLIFASLAEKHIESLTPKNVTMKNYARDVLFNIIDELDSYSHFGFFLEELERYLGFDIDDDVTSDILFKCCCEGKTDVERLKQELIEHLNFLEFPEKYGQKIRLDSEEFYIKK